MGTIHARSAEDAITRMSLLLESETKLSSDQLKKMIAKHIQYIIYLKNFKVASITEMIDYQEVTSNFVYKTLYERKEADENLVNPH
jgi:Flp pilus assembly CpaF family ATPase